MQSFFDKMDICLKEQENALRDITNSGGGGSGNNNGYCGGGGRYCKRKNVSKYYWTHGACFHDSRSCNNKSAGHKPTATFQNKLGGSTSFCN